MPHDNDMVSACIQYDYPQHFTTFFPPFTTSPEQQHAVKSTARQRWQGLLSHHGESWRWPKRCSEADRSLLTQDPDLLTRKDLWQCGQHGHIKNLEHIPKIWQNMSRANIYRGSHVTMTSMTSTTSMTSMTTGYRYPQGDHGGPALDPFHQRLLWKGNEVWIGLDAVDGMDRSCPNTFRLQTIKGQIDFKATELGCFWDFEVGCFIGIHLLH